MVSHQPGNDEVKMEGSNDEDDKIASKETNRAIKVKSSEAKRVGEIDEQTERWECVCVTKVWLTYMSTPGP